MVVFALTPFSADAQPAALLRGASVLAEVGVTKLLLREPALDATQVLALAERLRPLFADGLYVHERCAGAREAAAQLSLGLHLRGTSDWAAERDRWPGPLGASTHSEAEVLEAARIGLQWAFLSPLARPTSKPGDTRPTLGEARIVRAHDAARAARASFDLYALGGATPDAAARLASRGIGVAVLGGLWSTGADGVPEADAEAAHAFVRAAGSRDC